jgi:hypothetical protein
MRKVSKKTPSPYRRDFMLIRRLAAIFGVFVASLIILAGALRAEEAAAPVEQPAAEVPPTSDAPASETPASDAPAPASEPSAEEPKE